MAEREIKSKKINKLIWYQLIGLKLFIAKRLNHIENILRAKKEGSLSRPQKPRL